MQGIGIFIIMNIRETLRKRLIEQVDETWYHGSDHKFSSFENFKSSGPSALGIFVTDDRGLAEIFGENIYEVEISFSNAKKISMDKWDSIREKHAGNTSYFEAMRQQLVSEGYDCLFIGERSWTSSGGVTFKDGNIVALFDKSQIRIKDGSS